MHGGQGWPAMPLVSCQYEAMAAPTCAAQEASWARTTPPLFERQIGHQSYVEAAAGRLYFLLEDNYNIARGLCTLVPFIITVSVHPVNN